MYCTYKPEDLKVKDINYLWPGVIPYGFPTFVNGSTGLGKTNIMIKVAANATKGIFQPEVLDGCLGITEKKDPIRCLYISTENPVCEIVYPAFLHNEADISNVRIANEEEGHFVLCTEDLTAAVEDFNPGLIIVDAFQEHLPEGCSISDGEKMSVLIREIERFTYRHNIALVLIGNDAKGSESRSDANKMLGSGVISRKARVLITVKEEGGERVLSVTKKMGYKHKAETLIGYRFNEEERLEFYAYGGEEDNDKPAVRFLKEMLMDRAIERNELFGKAGEAGISKDQLYSSREEAGARIIRNSDKSTTWYIPDGKTGELQK